ncbi:hypothetical protein J2Y54_003136 [Sphingomonas sp. BE123]|uniref:hypothetical protein n=1 Tax=Sphingomonas sp. BE123 TaxID=2817842 RepID=UPI0028604A27|nr:hypothetical protein [Sphingomonas sp. BE123]MDR6853616.1 hypothetical protein [Sphingomonas sp. BE123]
MGDDLDNSARDHLVAITRGAVNAVPFVGGLLGELVTATIPRQRQDRIATYLRKVEERLATFEAAEAKAALQNPEKIDLIEAGGYLAVRATNAERIRQIADVVAHGLARDDADVIRRKRLLSLLGEIDDDEVAILSAYGQSYGGNAAAAWEKIDRPTPAGLGGGRALVEENQLFELGTNHLLRLNLLERRFNIKKGQVPELDPKTGLPKSSIQISYLGRMLLRSMGVNLPYED